MCVLLCGLYREAPERPSYAISALPLKPADLSVSTTTDRDLDAIVDDHVLRVALPTDPTSWYLDSKRFRGFDHDVLRGFARSQRLLLRIVPIASAAERLEALRDGEVDLVAGRVFHVDDPELVSRTFGEGPRAVIQTTQALCDGEGVDALADLEGKRILVVDGAGDLEAIQALGLDDDPTVPAWQRTEIVVLPDDTLLEQVVERMLAEGGVVVGHPDHIQPLLDNATLGLQRGPEFPSTDDNGGSRIALRRHSTELAEALDLWLTDNADAVERSRQRYLKGARWRPTLVISDYDGLFKAEAKRIGWRWPLLASVAWQESRFNAEARSVVGAQGMMQIMPATGGDLGLEDPNDPVQSVRAGATYLRQLERRWQARIPDPKERVAFVLASYNAGIGHVEDAVELARLSGVSGLHWKEVAPWLQALAHPEWNKHPAVRYGYCRGDEPVDYVDAILNRWEGYEAVLGHVGTAPDPLW